MTKQLLENMATISKFQPPSGEVKASTNTSINPWRGRVWGRGIILQYKFFAHIHWGKYITALKLRVLNWGENIIASNIHPLALGVRQEPARSLRVLAIWLSKNSNEINSVSNLDQCIVKDVIEIIDATLYDFAWKKKHYAKKGILVEKLAKRWIENAPCRSRHHIDQTEFFNTF